MAKILVVDDQESMRHIISGMLEEKGHSVVSAEDGAEAFDKFQESSFDLIVADVNMPKLNGLDFLKKVKTAKPATKVVFVTGMLEETIKLGAEKFGLDGLIIKPFEKPAALDTINKVLAR
jgi:CheY-like chemotaxis protein